MISKDDIVIEYQVIGSLLIDNSTHDYISHLKEDDFLDETNRKIFKVMFDLHKAKEEISILTIYDKADIAVSHLAEITDLIATTSSIESNIKVLKNKSNRRKLIQKSNRIIEMAKDTTIDIDTIKNNAMKEIDELESVVENDVITLKDAMLETTVLLDNRYKNKDDKSYYTGINRLDNSTAGLHPEELTTIGARPGVGKTIIGMQIAINVAKNKKKVMFTSLEMSVTQLCERIISANANIDGLRLRRGDIKNENEWRAAYKVAGEFSMNNYIIDKTSRNPQHIRTKLRKYKPDLLVIDYLQLLRPSEKQQSREQEVASITREIKLMTLEFKIPIIMLSQLNRNAEGKRPTMADLRESGAIEQDSDNIMFLHEPNEEDIEKLIKNDIYNIDFFKHLQKNNQKLTQLIIEKQRNGPVGTIDIVKAPQLMKFIDILNENH